MKSHTLLNFFKLCRLCCILLEMATFTVSEVHLVSKDQVFRIERGSDVILGCEFITSRFNLFDNPILWRKVQLNEDSQLNMMSNVLEPFRSRGRFKVTFSSLANKHKFNLSIADVTFEDVGNYTCEVNGPQNSLLGSVTYTIYVKAPLEILAINSIDYFTFNLDDHFPVERQIQILSKLKHNHFNFTNNFTSSSSKVMKNFLPPKVIHPNDEFGFKMLPPTKSQLIFGPDILKFNPKGEKSSTFDAGRVDHNTLPLTGFETAESEPKNGRLFSSFSNPRTDSKSLMSVPEYSLPSTINKEANYSENKPGKLSCIAAGLYPPTSLSLFVGTKNITNLLRHFLRAYPGKGIKGLRLIHFEVIRWTDELMATSEDDGQLLRCNAAFPGFPQVNNFTGIKMVVNYAPKVSCREVFAMSSQLEAKLSCRISSQPGVVSINWLSPRSGSSVNSSTIQQTMESSEYTLQNRIIDGVIETSLIIRRIQERHFGVYNVTAENGLEVGWGSANLQKREARLSPKVWAYVEHSGNQALKRGVDSQHQQKSSFSTQTFSVLTMTMILSNVLLPVIFRSS